MGQEFDFEGSGKETYVQHGIEGTQNIVIRQRDADCKENLCLQTMGRFGVYIRRCILQVCQLRYDWAVGACNRRKPPLFANKAMQF